MRHGWRVAACTALAVTAATAGCGASEADEQAAASASESSAAAAGATAAPGTYGQPVDPSLPNPTGVATDPPLDVGSSTTARVSIAYSGWNPATSTVEVDGFLGGIVESGGTCTLTLSQGSATAVGSKPAEPDATSTSCAGLSVAGSGLAAGRWSAVVSYESATSLGESPMVEVDVP